MCCSNVKVETDFFYIIVSSLVFDNFFPIFNPLKKVSAPHGNWTFALYFNFLYLDQKTYFFLYKFIAQLIKKSNSFPGHNDINYDRMPAAMPR